MHDVIRGAPRIPVEAARLIASPQAYARQKHLLSAFRHLRAANPVGRVELDDFDPFWVVTRHADILAVSRRHDIFRNGDRATALVPRATDQRIRALTRGSPHLIRTPVHMDAPDHPAYRAIAQGWFTRPRVQLLEQRMREFARQALDRMAELGGECEFVHDIARLYPLQVMLCILGIPEQDAARILMMTEIFFRSQDDSAVAVRASARDPARHADHLFEVLSDFRAYFRPLIKARLVAPRDDLLTAIAQAKIGGEPIRSFEAVSYLLILATAGHHTTSSAIAGGIWGLCRQPRELRRVIADRSLIPGLVDEAIRWTTPVQHFMRTAVIDTEVGGRRVAAGDWLMLCYLSGSRDDAVFDKPDRFRIDRDAAHVSFGHGVHLCLGQHLARLEMRIFFEELLSRIDTIELRGEPRRCASVFVGGPTYVPVRYRMTRR